MSPKKGNSLPPFGRAHDDPRYASIVATALRDELGVTHQATKTVMRWTGASESAAKQWLRGQHGPAGDYLITLMRESEKVFQSISLAAGHHEVVLSATASRARSMLRNALAALDECATFPNSAVD